jgi:Zn-finger nucleic acid-binding protein
VEELSGRQLRGEPLRCPVDGSRLVQTERSEILVDACPECRGVWLDRGELDRILVKEREWAAGDAGDDFFREVEGRRRPDPSRDDDRYDERGGRKRRRGGFLEDLFEGFGD